MVDKAEDKLCLQRFIAAVVGGPDLEGVTGFVTGVLRILDPAAQDEVINRLASRAQGGELFAYRCLKQMILEIVAKRKDTGDIPLSLSNVAWNMMDGKLTEPKGSRKRCPDMSFRFALMVEQAKVIYGCSPYKAIEHVQEAIAGMSKNGADAPSFDVIEEAVKDNNNNPLGLF
ncbi:hypothetical protein [Candidatus Rariloculus sp.]|uniref:hypothetical protein n=1 Tax=Candidatus Rariloculus sp. TaxID=3101265 RepID=UPI003D12D480